MNRSEIVLKAQKISYFQKVTARKQKLGFEKLFGKINCIYPFLSKNLKMP